MFLIYGLDDQKIYGNIMVITRKTTVKHYFACLYFQRVVENIDKHREDAKWLVKTLDELLVTSPEDTAKQEQEKLDEILKQYKSLMPAVEITTTKSSIVVKCIEYREVVEKRTEWLAVAEEKLQEDVSLDDLDQVRVLVEEQEVSIPYL